MAKDENRLDPAFDANISDADDEVIDLLEVVKPGKAMRPVSDADEDFSADLESMLETLSKAEQAKAGEEDASAFPDPTPVDHVVDPNESLDLPGMDDLDDILNSLGAPVQDPFADSDVASDDTDPLEEEMPDLDAVPVVGRKAAPPASPAADEDDLFEGFDSDDDAAAKAGMARESLDAGKAALDSDDLAAALDLEDLPLDRGLDRGENAPPQPVDQPDDADLFADFDLAATGEEDDGITDGGALAAEPDPPADLDFEDGTGATESSPAGGALSVEDGETALLDLEGLPLDLDADTPAGAPAETDDANLFADLDLAATGGADDDMAYDGSIAAEPDPLADPDFEDETGAAKHSSAGEALPINNGQAALLDLEDLPLDLDEDAPARLPEKADDDLFADLGLSATNGAEDGTVAEERDPLADLDFGDEKEGDELVVNESGLAPEEADPSAFLDVEQGVATALAEPVPGAGEPEQADRLEAVMQHMDNKGEMPMPAQSAPEMTDEEILPVGYGAAGEARPGHTPEPAPGVTPGVTPDVTPSVTYDEVDLNELDALLDDMLAQAPVSGPTGTAATEVNKLGLPTERQEQGLLTEPAAALVLKGEIAELREDVQDLRQALEEVCHTRPESREGAFDASINAHIEDLELTLQNLDGRMQAMERQLNELCKNIDKVAAEAAAKIIREELAALLKAGL